MNPYYKIKQSRNSKSFCFVFLFLYHFANSKIPLTLKNISHTNTHQTLDRPNKQMHNRNNNRPNNIR